MIFGRCSCSPRFDAPILPPPVVTFAVVAAPPPPPPATVAGAAAPGGVGQGAGPAAMHVSATTPSLSVEDHSFFLLLAMRQRPDLP